MSSSQGTRSTPIMKAPSRFLQAVVALAIKAGDKILAIHPSDFRVAHLPDLSPFTAANLVSHHFLAEALHGLSGGFPVFSPLSAETPFEDRGTWETYWLLAPLDGTLEFIRHSQEFTVNIALVHQHKPVLGVVYAPALQTCYFAAEGCGAFKKVGAGEPQAIHARLLAPPSPDVVGSRLHATAGMDIYLDRLGGHQFTSVGSALKFCQVAEGAADLYPRIGLTCEWDTAAAQCIVETAGGAVTDLQGRALLYNAKPSLVNPYFLAYGDKTRNWAGPALGIGGSPRSAPPPPTPLLKAVVALVREAGNRILEIYATDFRVGSKPDHTPLTAADLVSHHYLTEGLETLLWNVPVLSGESHEVAFEERSGWGTYWLVDPLNGTSEFIKRNGEFTVNVALILGHKPVLGVVYAPALQTCYFSAEGCGVFKCVGQGPPEQIHTRTPPLQGSVMPGNAAPATGEETPLRRLGEQKFQCFGSSLEFCKIAEGKACLYPCLAPTYEWDTAAAQYILEAVGGAVTDLQGEPLRYNAKASLLNPYFLAYAGPSRDWKADCPEFQALQSLMAA
jgi:3'(2'), 5'-bisphosphate nucleotidase